jgi:hypothetical protein
VTDPNELARACLYAVIDRFNTEDEFWGAFVPELDSTVLGEGRFTVVLQGGGARFEVQGMMLVDAGQPSSITPSLVVAGLPIDGSRPRRWHPITCAVDVNGRFVTSNFRRAIEAAIDDLSGGKALR